MKYVIVTLLLLSLFSLENVYAKALQECGEHPLESDNKQLLWKQGLLIDYRNALVKANGVVCLGFSVQQPQQIKQLVYRDNINLVEKKFDVRELKRPNILLQKSDINLPMPWLKNRAFVKIQFTRNTLRYYFLRNLGGSDEDDCRYLDIELEQRGNEMVSLVDRKPFARLAFSISAFASQIRSYSFTNFEGDGQNNFSAEQANKEEGCAQL